MPENARVCVIIAAWNQAEKTAACLETVLAQAGPAFDVLLVDNGSDPLLAETMGGRFPQVRLLRSAVNRGFAGGYNLGLRAALAEPYDYFCLLNNDTLLAPDCLARLVEALDRRPAVGLVTAKIYYAYERERIWTVGADFHPLLLEIVGDQKGVVDRGEWEEPRPIGFAPFCGVLVRREVWERVGLLDEDFFLYYEDMDMCRRLQAAGISLLLEPRAQIWHAVSASSGGSESPAHLYWLAQASGRYFRKHGRGWRLLLIVPYRLGSALRKTVRLAAAGRWPAVRAYWRGLAIGWWTGKAVTPPPGRW